MAGYASIKDPMSGWEVPMEVPETPEERKERERINIENELCKSAIKKAKEEEKQRVLAALRVVAQDYVRGLEVPAGEGQEEDEEILSILAGTGIIHGGKRARKTKKYNKKHTKKHGGTSPETMRRETSVDSDDYIVVAPPSSTSTASIVPEYDFTQKVSSGHYIPVNPLKRQRKHRTRKLLRKMKERFTRRRPVGGKKHNKKHTKKH